MRRRCSAVITARGDCVGYLSCGNRQDHLRPARLAKPWRLTSWSFGVGSAGEPCAGADRPAESFLSSPEPLRSSPLINTATELGNQQSRIKPHGVMPVRLFAFPTGAMVPIAWSPLGTPGV